MTAPTIILVEDDPPLRTLTARALQEHGYQVRPASSGPEMWVAFDAGPVDLVVLDVMLPGTNGIDLCRQIRRKSDVPIIFISAKGSETDRIVGLELGADDYLRKPFEPEELEARVRALGRRRGGDPTPQLVVGALTINRSTGMADIAGRSLDLRRRELAVLDALATRAGQVVPRELLIGEVFGFDEPVGGNAIEVHVTRLRGKLAPDGPGIRTVRGVGYMLDAD